MAKNRLQKERINTRLPVKRFTWAFLLCASVSLNACGKLPIPGFEEMDKMEKRRHELQKEISYMDEKRPKGGPNPKNLFGRNLRNDSERMDRLERAVQDMRNEFDSVKPSIKRLSALEGEIQRLINELKTLNGEAAPMPAAPAPKVKKPTPPPVKKAYIPPPSPKNFQKKTPPPVTQGNASVYDVRVGEHPGRTRLVIDVNTKTPFSVDIDNNEKIALIELPQASWSAAKSKNLGKSGFISSYSVESSGSGHILILQLKKSAKVSYKDDLKGTTGQSRRLVIDLIGA